MRKYRGQPNGNRCTKFSPNKSTFVLCYWTDACSWHVRATAHSDLHPIAWAAPVPKWHLVNAILEQIRLSSQTQQFLNGIFNLACQLGNSSVLHYFMIARSSSICSLRNTHEDSKPCKPFYFLILRAQKRKIASNYFKQDSVLKTRNSEHNNYSL